MSSSLIVDESCDKIIIENNVNKCKQLIKSGFDFNNLPSNSSGGSFLNFAVDHGRLEIVELILEKTKANMNRLNRLGFTCLGSAVNHKDVYMVELLLKYGANPNLYCRKDFKNNGLISLPLILLLRNTSCRMEETHVIDIEKYDEERRRTNGRKIDYSHAIQCCTCTSIQMARHGISCATEEILKRLIIHGANVNIPDDKGNTPLHLVCNSSLTYNLKLAEILIANKANKANVNALNYNKENPLYFAIRMGNLNIVKLLLEHNADQYITPKIDVDNLLSVFIQGEEILKLLNEYSVRDKIKLMHHMRKFERYAFHNNYCSLDIFNSIIKLLLP